MGRLARGTAITVAVVLVALAAGLLATVASLAGGSSGAVVGPAGYVADGVTIERLSGATTPLETGDVVVAIDGTSMADWAAGLFDLARDRPVFPPGTTVAMTIRDVETRTVDVITASFPIGPVVLLNLGTIAFVVAFLIVAVYAFWRRPRDEAAAALLIASVGAFASTIPWLLGIDPLDFATGAFWLDYGTVSLVYLLLWAGGLHFALTFPRRSPILGRRPETAVLPYALVFGLYGIGIAATARVTPDALAWIASWNVVQLVVVIGSLVAIMVAIADAWRRSAADERRAFRWVALASAFAVLTSIVLVFIPELLTGQSLVPWSLVGFIDIPVPLALAAAILRHQAFGIEVVVRRFVVYGGLTTGVVLVYAAIVAGLSGILGAEVDYPVRLLAAGSAALVVLPLRDVLQRAVGRYIYGDRDQPYRAISRLNERLALTTEPGAALQTVADTIAEALRLPYVAVQVGHPGRIVASHGGAMPGVFGIPLVHGGETVGSLLASPHVGEDTIESRDRSLLEDLAGQAAATVHAVRLTLDLQASRERLVSAREEERRRLRRDLHDGLGPALAGMAMRAEAAAALTHADPEEAARMLEELRREARDALADIRRLVYGLRPPALDELGLGGAIRQVAERMEPKALAVDVDVPEELPDLPAAAEVAAYRIVVEAVTNVVHHASAHWCRIRLRADDGLSIDVDDDGVGVEEGIRPGVGLTSMHERAEELGGSFIIASRPEGGTRVHAWLPLGERFEPRPAAGGTMT
jgi:signal transduction histidine kinase